MKTALTLMAALGSAFATPAFASDDAAGASRSVEVRYSDLNLATAGGVASLKRRISDAATRICGDSYSRDLGMRAAVAKCRTAAIDSTRVQMADAISAAQRGQAYAQVTGGSIAVSH